jgi:plastocyanin
MNQTLMKSLMMVLAVMLMAVTAYAGEIVVEQKNKSFVKDGQKVEAITIHLGDTIQFKNQDPWFHNIFSLSDVKTFDLGSYNQGEQRPVVFDKVGEADVECAIHPQMLLKVDVKK